MSGQFAFYKLSVNIFFSTSYSFVSSLLMVVQATKWPTSNSCAGSSLCICSLLVYLLLSLCLSIGPSICMYVSQFVYLFCLRISRLYTFTCHKRKPNKKFKIRKNEYLYKEQTIKTDILRQNSKSHK